eukprot:TRINITY_DN502_c0_g2_i1.p1 TRINITY_DN502_c0_g2~~TRINITY_DN502_c0_g2_i1.p1  ORF type:complete len:587 (+),score=104.74 TRINITY_DN502_c0_g2_i1:77-1837(+)
MCIRDSINAEYMGSPFVKCTQQELDQAISQVKDEYLAQTLNFGVGMHHAGLQADDRKVVEQLFVYGRIQVLIATSTLAWGVNFPARLVIIKGTEFFDPKGKRYVDMPVTDILQMIGRAGRPQFDDQGVACVYVEQSKKNFYRKYLNDPFPIESSLISQIHDHFNAEISSGTITNKQQCIDWITWTYFFRRLLKNPGYYNLQSSEPKEVKKYLIQLVDESMKRLQEHKCIKIDEENDFQVESTFLGNLGAFYYIKHETIFYYDQKITRQTSIPDLLRLLSYAKEFEEVPLRHNEENLNEELSQQCPLKVNKKAMDSPQEKTYLLFQAHIFRLSLPIRDYLTDTKLVIDSSVRIIHAMIELCAEKGYLNTTLNLICIIQMIMQGIWFDQSSLINVPYFDDDVIKQLNCLHLCELVELQNANRLERMLNKISQFANDKNKINKIIDAVNCVPSVRIRTQINSFDSATLTKEENNELVEEGGEAILTVDLSRENSRYPQKVKIQATQKIKEAGWWVIVGYTKADQVLGVKKIGFRDHTKKEFQITIPASIEQNDKFDIYLMSDSYLGLDQIYEQKIKINDKIVIRQPLKL